MLTVQSFRNTQLYNRNTLNSVSKKENQKYVTDINNYDYLNRNYSQVMFQGARVDKTIKSFVERNKDRMINTVSHYISHNRVEPDMNALTIHKEAFILLGLATSVAEIKDAFCSEKNKADGSYEPLFEDLKTPEEVNTREGIIQAVNYFKDLDMPLFKNSKEDLTTYLVKKLFLETKTLDEVNEDIENDLEPDYKKYIISKKRDDGDIITSNTLKFLGIKYNQPYFNSLRYARDGYSDMVGEKISKALLDCFNNLSDEEKTARSNKMKEVAQQRWNNMTPEQKAQQLSRMLITQNTQNGRLVKYVMYDAWNNCFEIITDLYRFLVKKDSAQTDMAYLDKEINGIQSQILAEFWARYPKHATKFGDAISDGYRKFRKTSDVLALEDRIEQERLKRIEKFENWKKQNFYINNNKTPNIQQSTPVVPIINDNRTICLDKLKKTFAEFMSTNELINENLSDVQQWCSRNLTDEDCEIILRNCDTKDTLNNFVSSILTIRPTNVENKELLGLLDKFKANHELTKYRLAAYSATLLYKKPTVKDLENVSKLVDTMTKEVKNSHYNEEDEELALNLINIVQLLFKNLTFFDTFSNFTLNLLNEEKKDLQYAEFLPVIKKHLPQINKYFDALVSKDLFNCSYKKYKEDFSTKEINRIINDYYSEKTDSEKEEIRNILKDLGKSVAMLYFIRLSLLPKQQFGIADEARIELHKLLINDDNFKVLETPVLKDLYALTEFSILDFAKNNYSILPEKYFDIYSKLIKQIDLDEYKKNEDRNTPISITIEHKDKLTREEREAFLIAKFVLNKDLADCLKGYPHTNSLYKYSLEDTIQHYLLAMNGNSQQTGVLLRKRGNPARIADMIKEYEELFKNLHEEFGDNIPVQDIIETLNDDESNTELDKILDKNIREYMLNPDSEYFN